MEASSERAVGSTPTAAVLVAGVAAVGFGLARVGGRQRQTCVECRAVGICRPLTEKFDPLKLGNTDAKMDRYSAVEVKHGRVAMLATLGYVMPEFFRFPGCESFDTGLASLTTIPVEGWVQLVAFLGAHEVLVKPRENGLGQYDFGFGVEILENQTDEEVERRQTSERNHGRLAMVGILGMMFQDGMFHKSPFALMAKDGFWGTAVDWFIKDIPMCRDISMCARFPGGPLPIWKANKPMRMSASLPYLEHPEQLDGWIGGEKGFDPMLMSESGNIYLFREAELKHGRIAMLATVGWIATDLGVRFPGEVFQTTDTLHAHDVMVEKGIFGTFLASLLILELWSGYLAWQGDFNYISRDAGDMYLGKNFLPSDKAKADEMRLKELENGRLAMLAFGGMATAGVLTQKPWPFI